VRSGGIRLRAAGNGLEVSRCGFAVIGARSAVERNRLRRRLRAATRPLASALPGLDVVTSVPLSWGTRPVTELDRELHRAWAQLERRLLGTAVLS
jgi:ribonuclease P protein component